MSRHEISLDKRDNVELPGTVWPCLLLFPSLVYRMGVCFAQIDISMKNISQKSQIHFKQSKLNEKHPKQHFVNIFSKFSEHYFEHNIA